MEKFQDTGMKQYSFIFLMLYKAVQKWKEKKKATVHYDFTFPSDYEGTELWFQYITARGKCRQMQSQREWVQRNFVFILGQSMGARLQPRPTARKGHKPCQPHSTTTSLLLWRAETLCSSTWSICKVPAPRLEWRTGRSLRHVQH